MKLAKGKERAELEKIHNKLKRNLSINEGKLTQHRDKLQTKEAVKKGSAIMRHYLQQLKGDLPSLKGPILEYKQAMEGRMAEAVKGKFPEKAFEKTLANSLEGKVNPQAEEKALTEAAKATEGNVEENKSVYQEWWNEVKKRYQEYKKGNIKDPFKLAKAITGTYAMLPYKTRLIAGVLINAALKKIGMPGLVRYMFLPVGARLEKMAIVQTGGMIGHLIDNMMNDYYAGKLASTRTPSERQKMIAELKDKYGKTRSNKIIKASKGMKAGPQEKENILDVTKEIWLG